jgi:carboxypeptidase Taq
LAEALRGGIWQHGRRFMRDELLKRETGRGLDPAPYLAYLSNKYAQ